MPTKKITDLTKLTDLDATDSLVINDSSAGADKRVEFSDLQSEVLNGASIGTSTAITELQVDNLNLNGNTFSSTDTNGNILIQPNGTGATVINESGAASDFRVEGDTETNLLFVDASTDRVGIGTNTPAYTLDVRNDAAGTRQVRIINASTASGAYSQFRAESDSAQVYLGVSGSGNTVNGGLYDGDFAYLSTENNASGLNIGTGTGGQNIRIYTNGSGAGAERLRIDSSGNVGIGTSSPSAKLSVSGSGTVVNLNRSGVGTLLLSLDSAKNEIFSRDGTTGNFPLAFYVGTSERMRLTPDGLTFNGDTAAANALDDYEEGTWTPEYEAQTGTFATLTYSGQYGTYTKIGNTITAWFALATSNVSVGTASGNLTITGLPVAESSSTGFAGSAGSIGVMIRFATSISRTGLLLDDGSTSFFIDKAATNGASNSVMQVSDLTTGATTFRNYIIGTITYRTA